MHLQRFGLLLCSTLLLAACSEDGEGTEPCPTGTIRSGLDCLEFDFGQDVAPSDASADAAEEVGDDSGRDIVESDTEPDVSPDTPQGDADAAPDAPTEDVEPDVEPPPFPTGLPFAVDDYWAPSGFMGDGEIPGAIEVTDDACGDERAGAAEGVCRQFAWTRGAQGWAGVFWQYPDGNWGDLPGLPVPAGATEVTFYAWGAEGGEVVKFLVGIGDVDGFAVETADLTLTDAPAEYRVDVSGASIGDEVVGGFGWVSGDEDGVTFTIDDIQWR